MRRRDLLCTLGIGTLAAAGFRSAAAQPGEALTLRLRLGGEELLFSEADGEDLGDYRGPGFVQRCIRVLHHRVPFTVFFRPDRGSERVEVVIELGRCWGEPNKAAAHILTPYQAEIRRGERVLARIEVPKHWWFSRWRWQSAPRPVIRAPAELVAAKLVPPYSAEAARFARPLRFEGTHGKAIYAAAMDNAFVQMDMSGQGDRYDIGPVTEYQGAYLATGNAAALSALLAQAEASGSVPRHFRDERTAAPVDLFQHPAANWYYRSGTGRGPWIKSAAAIRTADGGRSTPWLTDSAHTPALAYVPFLLTGDGYHLEELQFEANDAVGWGASHREREGLQIVYPGQTRSFAWSMRALFQAARVSPETAPPWLLPRSYWHRIVDDNLSWFTRHYVEDRTPGAETFHNFTYGPRSSSWMNEFVVTVMAQALELGFEDWRRAYRWALENTLQRTNGTSGWPRQWCTPYKVSYAKAPPTVKLVSAAAIEKAGYPHFADWAEAWRGFKEENRIVEPFKDDTSWAQSNSPDFLLYTRGALAMATRLGVSEAVEPYRFVDAMMSKRQYMTYRWAIAPREGL